MSMQINSHTRFFKIIRAPLLLFPMISTNCTDALVALRRIDAFLTAEELEETYSIDNSPENEYDLRMNGSFTWETVRKANSKFDLVKSKGPGKDKIIGSVTRNKDKKLKRWWQKDRKRTQSNSEVGLPAPATSCSASDSPPSGSSEEPVAESEKDEKPFALTNVSIRIPKGSFVAIVGRKGSGKSSLLQSLVGEVRKIDREVVFGGTVAYVPQQPWIMNGTLRDNILFGRDEDVERYISYLSYFLPLMLFFKVP